MNILEAENVTKLFGNYKALDQVSISVPQNSIFGLLGPNGAGKTTLIRIINQIYMPDGGSVSIDGQPLQREHVVKIGYLPEERGLYKKMKVGEQLMYLARLKGMNDSEAKRRLKKWIEKFEIKGWWDKKIEELSKGMQQKIQFIATVLHEPKLIILDEPFSGFDPVNANIIKSEIQELQRNGSTIIFSTHRMESVEELCDHIALINKSKKILEGKKVDIKNEYKSNKYELKYKGELPESEWYQTVDTSIDSDGFNYALVQLNSEVGTREMMRSLIDQVDIVGFNEKIPTMNEIFISKVKSENHE